jgi:putative holliday junction resolvase
MNYLGIDWGEKRIGLALAQSETKIATPFKIVVSVPEILKVVNEEEIDLVILGKPNQISNLQYPISEQFKNFLSDLKNNLKIPIKLVDERLSSKAADALAGGKKVKASRDTIAAMIILQSYLDAIKNGRNL